MPSRPANVSLIHRRCSGHTAAPGREDNHSTEPHPLTFCSMSEPVSVGRDPIVEGEVRPRCWNSTREGVMGLVVKDDGWRIPDWLWLELEPLLPERPAHPLGCHNPRVPDRDAMNAILFVLRTGCQWSALNATGICSSSSAHRRFQEWERAGVVRGAVAARSARLRRAQRDRVGVAGDGRSDDQGAARWQPHRPQSHRQSEKIA